LTAARSREACRSSAASRFSLTNLSVGGNILVEGARGTLVLVGLDTVAGQVQVVNNRLAVGPGFGFNIVEGNTIGGNLRGPVPESRRSRIASAAYRAGSER
jgi:hypothetical protein